MKCPFCDNEMVPGKIEAQSTIAFTPAGEKRDGYSYHSLSENGVSVSKRLRTRLFRGTANANYCKTCDKLIVDVYKKQSFFDNMK